MAPIEIVIATGIIGGAVGAVVNLVVTVRRGLRNHRELSRHPPPVGITIIDDQTGASRTLVPTPVTGRRCSP